MYDSFTQVHTLLILILLSAILLVLYFFFFPRGRKQGWHSNEFDNLYLKIKDEIQASVVPHFVQVTPDAANLVEVAVEVWRLEQRLGKAASSVPENLKRGMDNSITKFKRFREKYDMEVIDYAGQKYNDGLNIEILSVEKDSAVVAPTIKETVEPAITYKGRIIKKAKVILVSNEM